MKTKEELILFVEEFERELFNAPRFPFAFGIAWLNNFLKEPGIYVIYDKETLLYIGETANLRERMKEVKRTINHSFRVKLGKHLYKGVLERGKFNNEIEGNLNKYYVSNLSFASLPLWFGRLEVETHLIKRNKLTLLNSPGIR